MWIANIAVLVVPFALFGGIVALLAHQAARDRRAQALRPPTPTSQPKASVRNDNHSGSAGQERQESRPAA